MKFTEIHAAPAALNAYAALFAACFPLAKIGDPGYLMWLYGQNPVGTVVGFDAWDGEILAAHYACIPAEVQLAGQLRRVLLSLNTATDPRYQGQGLFTRLAAATYEAAQAQGFAAVYGVANANSTPGFLRKLAFQHVAPLRAAVGFGGVPCPQDAEVEFCHQWTADSLAWRCANPHNPVRVMSSSAGQVLALASAGKPSLRAYAEVPAPSSLPVAGISCAERLLPRVYLGLMPSPAGGAYLDIPSALKPSPLNLIYRCLDETIAPPRLEASRVRLSFLDFDAF